MHRLWIGKDWQISFGGLMAVNTMLVLVMHLFAFKALGWPGSVGQKFPNYAAPSAAAPAAR